MNRFSLLTTSQPAGILPFAMFCLALAGCGSGQVPVSGTVTLDNQPVSGVNLRFFPLEGSVDALPSFATSGEGGVFTTSTNADPGMLKGSYRVAADYPDPDYKPKKEAGLNFGDPQPPPDKLKGKYLNSEMIIQVTGATSDLKIELTTGS